MGRPAAVDDVHAVASGMPHVVVARAGANAVYQVGGKSFVFFRNARPDAVDESGQRLTDVIVLWVASAQEKEVLLADESLPLFTTPHFDGHPSVLVRAARLGEIDVEVLTELVQDAWLSQASRRRASAWLREHGLPEA